MVEYVGYSDRAEKRKGLFRVFLILIIFLVVVAIFYFLLQGVLNFSGGLDSEDNVFLVNLLTYSKCRSECPLSEGISGSVRLNYFCELYCNNTYFPSSTLMQDLSSLQISEISSVEEQISLCEKDYELFQSCIEEILRENSNVVNLDDFILDDYPEYQVEIVKLGCKTNSADVSVSLKEGGEFVDKIHFFLNGIRIDERDPPSKGVIFNYNIIDSRGRISDSVKTVGIGIEVGDEYFNIAEESCN